MLWNYPSINDIQVSMVKFMFSKKATKIDKIFTIDLKVCIYVVSVKLLVKISSIFVAFLENYPDINKSFIAWIVRYNGYLDT